MCMLNSFTQAAFFVRCSGDWCQFVGDIVDMELRARLHYSTVLNLEEAYKYWKTLGLVGSSGSEKTRARFTMLRMTSIAFYKRAGAHV